MAYNRRIYRIQDGKMIGGVCNGLARYFDTDPTWIRLAFVLSIFLHGVGLIAYLVAWIVFPKWPEAAPSAATPGGAPPSPGDAVAATPQPDLPPPAADAANGTSANGGNGQYSHSFLVGLILIALGVVFFFAVNFSWFSFQYIWPLILIGLGGVLLYRAMVSRNGTNETTTNGEVVDESR